MDDDRSGMPPVRQRMLDLARAVTPPRFLRLYQERTLFRRRVQRVLAWSFVPVLVWAFVFADGGLASILSRRVRVWKLERQVAQLERRQELLQHSIERRENDPAVLERLARERYGMARPGEKVYRIVEIDPEEARRIAKEQKKLAKAARAAEERAVREAEDRAAREAGERTARNAGTKRGKAAAATEAATRARH